MGGRLADPGIVKRIDSRVSPGTAREFGLQGRGEGEEGDGELFLVGSLFWTISWARWETTRDDTT